MINANKFCQSKYEINNTKVLYHKQHFISKPKDWNADVSHYNNNVDLNSVYPIIRFLTGFSTALTTILPILFQYCYKCCYSDSRNF